MNAPKSTAAGLIRATGRIRQIITVQVPSESRPGVSYTVSGKWCTCPDYVFTSPKTVGYRCKHMIRRFPPVKMCPICRLNPISDLPTCSAACTRAARKLDMARWTPEPYNSFAPMVEGAFCHCLACGKRYSFSDESDATRLYCPKCLQVALHGERRAS